MVYAIFCIPPKRTVVEKRQRLRRKEQGAAVFGRGHSGNGVGSQQGQRGGQAMVTEAEAAREQTTINQKAVAIAAVTVLVTAEMVAAAMAAVMVLAPTGAEVAVNMGWR